MKDRENIVTLINAYETNEKFKEYVDKVCASDRIEVMEALQKYTVELYYKSLLPGECNSDSPHLGEEPKIPQ